MCIPSGNLGHICQPYWNTTCTVLEYKIHVITYLNREDDMSASRPFYNIDTTTIKAPEGQGCPRCGGVVFDAEKQLAKGSVSRKLLSYFKNKRIKSLIYLFKFFFCRCGIRVVSIVPCVIDL